MDTRVIYAAAAASLDSWDIENLRYVIKRKYSTSNSPGSGELDAVSYISEQNENEKEQKDKLESMPLPMLELDLVDTTVNENNNDHSSHDDNDERKIEISRSNDVRTTSMVMSEPPTTDISCSGTIGRPPLDDCYLLDIVTVRNDSVLAFTPNGRVNVSNNSAGSASSPSSASSTSSVDESNDIKIIDSDQSISDQKREIFDFSLEEDSFICRDRQGAEAAYVSNGEFYYTAYRRKNSACSIGTDPPSIIISKEKPRFPGATSGHCPFCDQSKVFFNQALNLEDLSIQAQIGEPPIVPNQSPSPYYVRLRRDLLTTITPPPHHPKNRPHNFSVNTEGRLAIDYSSNWRGLENYVKNLKFDKN